MNDYTAFLIKIAVHLAGFYLALSCAAAGPPAPSADGDTFSQYTQKEGDDLRPIYWCRFQTSADHRLVCQTTEQTWLHDLDDQAASIMSQAAIPGRKTAFSARREGNTIHVQGRVKGRSVNRKIIIDDKPWFQAAPFNLREFALSGRKRLRFWILGPDAMDAFKAVAIHKGTETIDLNGRRLPAIRVDLRFTGVLAPYWKSRYWFEPETGRFLRYKGPGGHAGSPSVVIFFEKTVSRCPPFELPANPVRN